MLLVAIYTPGWRGTVWGKVSCLRKRHNSKDQTLHHWTSNLKSRQRSNHFTTVPSQSVKHAWYNLIRLNKTTFYITSTLLPSFCPHKSSYKLCLVFLLSSNPRLWAALLSSQGYSRANNSSTWASQKLPANKLVQAIFLLIHSHFPHRQLFLRKKRNWL